MASLLATAGPFVGVRQINDAPYIDWSQYLYKATNGYIRDVANKSSWRSRPGFTNTNPSSLIGGGAGVRVAGAHTHVDPSTGTIYRFFIAGGKVYLADSAYATFTDVTPIGVSIVNGTTRVSMTSVGASLVVTDGVFRPWVATNLGSVPITGTYIDIDGAGGSWSAKGRPTVYQDSIMFITSSVPVGSPVQAGVGFVWSEPNQPTVGYTQSAAGYANFWNMIETGSDPLTCIFGTNSGLFIWRQSALTVAAGTPSINFSSTATRDSRGDAVGSLSPWAVSLYNDTFYFLDSRARVWQMPVSGEPVPVWEQMNADTISAASLDPINFEFFVQGAIVPELNLYVAGIPFSASAPRKSSAFDAASGAYVGEWTVGNALNFESMDVMQDANGAPVLCVTSSGAVWLLSALEAGVWADGTVVPMSAQTGPLGFSADTLMHPTSATIIVTSPDPLEVLIDTPYGQSTLFVTPTTVAGKTPDLEQYRAVIGLDGSATRWMQLTVVPSVTPTAQFGLQRIDLFGTTELAGPNDP